MKRLALLGALWFAATGVSAIATAADKAMEDKKAPAATNQQANHRNLNPRRHPRPVV